MRIVCSLLISLFLSFYLSGCAQTEPQKTQTAMIVWKSPSFRYADMGFISDYQKSLKVEIYGSGSALMRLEINDHTICMNRYRCMPKGQFNSRFLSASYPDTILEHIFRGKPIFDGESLSRKRNGFTQNIKKSNLYEIAYSVLNNQIIFRDTINQIVIKVIKQ